MMEFQINKNVLNSTLNIVNKAISQTAPIPSLSGVKIEVFEDKVTFIGSDADLSISKTLHTKDKDNELVIKETGTVVLDAKYISEIVRKIDGRSVKIEILDGTLTKITGVNATYRINGIRATDYPTISFDVGDTTYTMDTMTFEKICRQTTFACSDKETRPALMGVNFKADGDKLICSATNSFRLATKTINLNKELHFDITIPAKTLNNITSILDGNDEFAMAIDPNKISFVFDDTIIRARLIDNAFPDVSRLVPPSFSQTLVVNTKDLLDAAERTSFIKSEGKNVIKLTINSTTLNISSSSQEIGSSNEDLPVISFTGDPITISCSGRYMIDALKTITDNTVVINFSGELRPIVIKAQDDSSLIQIISPVRS